MQDIDSALLAELGEDPAREGLRDTPRRVEQALRFLTSGYDADIDAVLNDALFTVDYNEMVIVRDIDFYSLCEHHLLPFFGKCHVAYIPDGKVIGLSKIPRLVDVFARRLQVQERLTIQIAETHRRDKISAARRRRRHGSDAPVHGHARRREAELVHDDQRDARRVPRGRAHAPGVPGAHPVRRTALGSMRAWSSVGVPRAWARLRPLALVGRRIDALPDQLPAPQAPITYQSVHLPYALGQRGWAGLQDVRGLDFVNAPRPRRRRRPSSQAAR